MSETVIINGRSFRVVSSATSGVVKVVTEKRKAHRAIPTPLDGEPVSRGTLMLSSRSPSVNGLFFNSKKGRGKTLAYRNWRLAAARELRAQASWHVPGKVRITVRVGGSRADIDNLCKAPLDALVAAGRIQDDRNVVEARAIHDATVLGTLVEIERANNHHEGER